MIEQMVKEVVVVEGKVNKLFGSLLIFFFFFFFSKWCITRFLEYAVTPSLLLLLLALLASVSLILLVSALASVLTILIVSALSSLLLCPLLSLDSICIGWNCILHGLLAKVLLDSPL